MDAITLDQLQNPASAYYTEAKKAVGAGGASGNLRLDAVREAALGVGLRGGLKARTDAITAALEQTTRQLDTAYDFRAYLIQGRVLPAVISESRDIYTQGSDVVLRLAGRNYKVESQARFVSRAPTWRDYLVMRYEVAMPSPSLLPKTPEEGEVWKRAVAEGWAQGQQQGDTAFRTNFDRLDRDFYGVLRFHRLAAQNVVSMPIVARTSMPVTGNKGQISIDETLLRLTALPAFNLNVPEWKATPGKYSVRTGAKASAAAEGALASPAAPSSAPTKR